MVTMKDDALQLRFSGYLKKAIINKRIEYIKKQAAREHEDIIEYPLEIGTTDPGIGNAEFADLLGHISPRDKNILYLKIIEGRSFVEISGQLHIKYSTVAKAYKRALQRLKRELQEDDK